MKLLSLFAFLMVPLTSIAGGNILNGPRNCQSLAAENFDAGDPGKDRFEALCYRAQNGEALTAYERKVLTNAGVEFAPSR
jgi:hypothetical protein